MKEMFERQIGGAPDIKIATKRADSLWAFAGKATDGSIPKQELLEACRTLVETQVTDSTSRCNNLWPVMIVDQMPSEAWVDFVYMPSYAACAILLYGYRNGYSEDIPKLESTLRSGLSAAFPNGLVSSHGNECDKSTQNIMDLMYRSGLKELQDLFSETLKSAKVR